MHGRAEANEWELRQLVATFFYLYGIDITPLIKTRSVEVERSPKTGRIRHVYIDGKMFASLRSSDGFLVLTPEGWSLLQSQLHSVAHVVEINSDVARFVSKGRSLFSKHVSKADPSILPGDDVCIISQPEGSIVAVGRAVLPGEDMGRIKRGKAVKVRKGVNNL